MAVNIDRWTREGRALLNALAQLDKNEVRIGYQQEMIYPDGTPMVLVAMINEFGTSKIPSRPFMRQTVDKNEQKIHTQMQKSAQKLATGATSIAVLNELGVFGKSLIQKEIKDGGFVPNAPYTIMMKGSDKPLIDTGLMRQSANYVIKMKGSR